MQSNTFSLFTTKKIRVNNININYAHIGKGQPLILIHGWANNWIGMVPLALELKKSFSIYLIDLPGFGDSDPLKEYNIKNQAKYVYLFLKTLKIKPQAIIGLSMGSLITAQIGKDYPKITKKIILLSPVFKTKNHQLISKIVTKTFSIINKRDISKTLLKKAIELRIASYLTAKYINMYKFNKFLIDSYGMIGKKKMTKEAFIQMGLSSASFQLEKVLNNYSLPVLLIYGEKDKITTINQAKEILKDMKEKFQFASISFAGHIVSTEKPKQTTKRIKDFLSKN